MTQPSSPLTPSGRTSSKLTVDVLIDEEAEPDLSIWFGDLETARRALTDAAIAAASVERCFDGTLGVRICDDAAIHPINREFLNHDYPTDVISFPYELDPPRVEGELVASFETAVENTSDPANSLTPREELLLYVVHGTLHIVGHDDQSAIPRAAMRRAEAVAMEQLGIHLPIDEESVSDSTDDPSADDGGSAVAF
ncbi:rRNA maturation RNase YbeY [Rhodopirellula sp. JC740]|uniref:Endoribonuclease YbeY n=1 Tax=Rhodopirellula halodulae TaxID=2894198 RepID=A0ABS8NMK6_9BACT|nr:rRNA maturation RNase YbeY [Rhodopirellula sp. JC740]